MKWSRIEVIFDYDHGTINHGWYIRDQRAGDGQETDVFINAPWAKDADTPDHVIRDWAVGYYATPDTTNEERQQLHDIVKVKR